jgi:2-keto-3-deoxy-L-rhamnonate aldolase RhmA
MRARLMLAASAAMVYGGLAAGQGGAAKHLNPMIELHQQKKPVFGLYAPANRTPRGNRGAAADAPPATPPPVKTALELAKEALAYEKSDFIFDGNMERSIDPAIGRFTEFVNAMADAAPAEARWRRPLSVKTTRITPDPAKPDPAKATENISRQLNLGVATIVFVDVESAEELKTGITAMRFKSKGGTRPDAVGAAPKYWGMNDAQYREKADLWPLNPNGELTAWAIVESKEGIARVREIAAVKGIAALFPGAGTLRGVYSTTNAEGQRTVDTEAWEAAIQQVLAACKEFNVACGYPATENDIEMRMKQGFSVFIMNWGEAGFRAIDIGRRASGR